MVYLSVMACQISGWARDLAIISYHVASMCKNISTLVIIVSVVFVICKNPCDVCKVVDDMRYGTQYFSTKRFDSSV